MDRLTIARYVSSTPVSLPMPRLDALNTGYAQNTIVPDGPRASRATLGENARTAPSHQLSARRAAEAEAS